MPHLLPLFFAAWSWTTLDLVNHLWQSTAAGLAVLGLLFVCAPLSARTRRSLGLMAMAKFAVPVAMIAALATRFFGKSERWLESPALTLPAGFSPPPAVAFAAISPAQAVPTAHWPAGWLLMTVWAAGFAAVFGWWLVRGWRARRRILEQAGPVPAAMEERIARAAARAGLRPIPRCATVPDTLDAGVLGVFSPVVILPCGLEDTLTPAELEAVLIHEFVHLQRRDNLWGALQYFLASLFWFHPIMWLLNRRLGLETEKSCDERVLEITGDPEIYAGGLVKCVYHAMGVSQPNLAGMATPPVVARMKNILAHGTRRDRPVMRGAAMVTGLALLGFSGCAGSFANKTPPVAPPSGPLAPAATTAAPAPFSAGADRPQPRYQRNEQTGNWEVTAFDNQKTLSVDFADEDIRTVIRTVADRLELNIIIPDTLRGRATLKAANQPWREIYKSVLAPLGHTFLADGNIVIIVPADRAPAANRREPSRAETTTAGPKKSPGKDTLSVDFPDENIRNIIQNIAELFALKVAMPDSLQGKITIKLRDVTWRQIFQGVLAPAGYTFVEDGGVVRIVPVEKTAALAAPAAAPVDGERPATKEATVTLPAPEVSVQVAGAPPPPQAGETATHPVATIVTARDATLTFQGQGADTPPVTIRGKTVTIQEGDRARQPNLASPEVGDERLEATNQKILPPDAIAPLPVSLTNTVPAIAASFAPKPSAAEPDKAPAQPTDRDLTSFRGIRVFDPSQLDRMPVPTLQAKPLYPFEMRRAGVGGQVVVDFLVDDTGNVRNAYALKSSRSEFEAAAVQAVAKWKFQPGRKDGRAVHTHLQVPIVFTQNER